MRMVGPGKQQPAAVIKRVRELNLRRIDRQHDPEIEQARDILYQVINHSKLPNRGPGPKSKAEGGSSKAGGGGPAAGGSSEPKKSVEEILHDYSKSLIPKGEVKHHMTDAIDDLLKMQDEMRAKNPPRTTKK
jgi:hypothetical protein